MIQVETIYNTKVLDRLEIAIPATPQIIQEVVNTDVQPVVIDYVQNTLAKYPPKIAPGVFRRHATPKQFAYVMAKIRRGEWTGRTGALGRAWQTVIESTNTGAAIVVRNTSKVARYVVGDNQQTFHTITGWPRARERTVEFRRLVYLTLSESLILRFIERVGR